MKVIPEIAQKGPRIDVRGAELERERADAPLVERTVGALQRSQFCVAFDIQT